MKWTRLRSSNSPYILFSVPHFQRIVYPMDHFKMSSGYFISVQELNLNFFELIRTRDEFIAWNCISANIRPSELFSLFTI